MERIRIDRHHSLRARRRQTQADEVPRPLQVRATGGSSGGDDLVTRIEAVLEGHAQAAATTQAKAN